MCYGRYCVTRVIMYSCYLSLVNCLTFRQVLALICIHVDDSNQQVLALFCIHVYDSNQQVLALFCIHVDDSNQQKMPHGYSHKRYCSACVTVTTCVTVLHVLLFY